jgi:prepilin-type N-terminal cleavage/methylation domain-containing protein
LLNNFVKTKAFTLIEVLVSVAIITFVGTVLLKIVSNNTHFIALILQKSTANSFISLFSDIDKESNDKEFNIQNMLDKKYISLEKKLEESIKDKKVKYTDELLSTVFLLDLEDEEDEDLKDKQTLPNSKIDIRKKIISIENQDTKKVALEYLYYLDEHNQDE